MITQAANLADGSDPFNLKNDKFKKIRHTYDQRIN